MNNGLHAWPNLGLIKNVGFDEDGTHTIGEPSPYFSIDPTDSLGELCHPEFIVPCREADEFAYLHRRAGLWRIELDRYGVLHPWVLRLRRIKAEGIFPYLYCRLPRLFSLRTKTFFGGS
jgi:hypothetical protein